MNNNQFNALAGKLTTNIFGQFISIVSVTDPDTDLLPEFKNKNIKKIASFQTHIFKKGFLEIANNSTGAIKTGVEFNQSLKKDGTERKNPYKEICLNGFLSEKSDDAERKYVIVKFKGECQADVVYQDDKGKFFFANEILKPKKESAKEKAISLIAGEDEKPSIRVFKAESIYSLSVCGEIVIDESLESIIKLSGILNK